MKQNYKTIDYEWLTKPTGDPFADAGGFAIEYLSEKFPEKDILQLIDYITKIYVEKWGGQLSAYFLNSTITQPAFSGRQEIITINYFKVLVNDEPDNLGSGVLQFLSKTNSWEIITKLGEKHFCRLTGKETKVYSSGRDNYILSGSGTFINFHHTFDSGILVSKEIIIRMFFVPFGTIFLNNKVALINSHNIDISRFFVEENCKMNLTDIGKGIGRRPLLSEFKNPTNLLFEYLKHFVTELKNKTETKDIALTLYYFSNLGNSPDIELFSLPSKVFKFYWTCFNVKYRDHWSQFINAHYKKYQNYKSLYLENSSRYKEKAKEVYTLQKETYNYLYQNKIGGFNLCSLNSVDSSYANSEKVILDSFEVERWKKTSDFKKLSESEEYKSSLGKQINLKKIHDLEIEYSLSHVNRSWSNIIFERLTNDKPLVPYFLRWSRKHSFNFEIVSIYQQNIIGMKKETIIKIKELAAFLVREEDADKIKKRIKALDGAKNASALRRFILKDVVAANYVAMNENPIVTVDDYVNYLFPDGSYWAEIRDILLIAIYQELHERNLISEELKIELESEVGEEVIND
ncbi:MAG: type I-B CRISPR-associated protein Cas8b1/Cst1 [Bacteroidetes bacterium]|nr:type I-B CRISPR-associated protein Cas8b1/Cst1 [Bacteroidota bacterium]